MVALVPLAENMVKRFFLLFILGSLVLSGLIFFLLQPSDTVPERSIAFAELINQLSAARQAGDHYFKEKGSLVGLPEVERKALPNGDDDHHFQVATDGVLVAVDFNKKVAVLLTPTVQQNGLIWRCETMPTTSAPKLCNNSL